MISVLELLLAAVVGLSLGMLGGGGSILTVPIFVYAGGFAAKSAVAMSLPVVGVTSLVGAFGHWRAGNVNPRAALTFGTVAMAGAYAGARLATFLSGTLQLAILAIVMLGAAIAMLRGQPSSASTTGRRVSLPLLIATAMGVGLLTGVVGIGGGFLAVPALVLLARLPMKEAIGTSLLVIAMNAASGLLGYLGQVDIAWSYIGAFTAVAIAGILIGARLVRYVSQQALRRGFAVFLVAMGLFILLQNLDSLTHTCC